MISERDRLTAKVPGIGETGLAALKKARVLVVGAGGLGSPVLAYLAAAEVGLLGISDSDCLEISNLQRQVIHPAAHLGMQKSVSAAKTLAHLNPNLKVVQVPKIAADNVEEICSNYDVIVDCTDNFPTKYLLSDTCLHLHKPLVWGTLVGTTFQISTFVHGRNLRDLYPQQPAAGSTLTSQEVGVLGAVCGQAGAIMANEVIKFITGAGQCLVGSLLIVNTADNRWNVVQFAAEHKDLQDKSLGAEIGAKTNHRIGEI